MAYDTADEAFFTVLVMFRLGELSSFGIFPKLKQKEIFQTGISLITQKSACASLISLSGFQDPWIIQALSLHVDFVHNNANSNNNNNSNHTLQIDR